MKWAFLALFIPSMIFGQATKKPVEKNFIVMGDVVRGDTLISLRVVRKNIKIMGEGVSSMLKDVQNGHNREMQRAIFVVDSLIKEVEGAKKRACRIAFNP